MPINLIDNNFYCVYNAEPSWRRETERAIIGAWRSGLARQSAKCRAKMQTNPMFTFYRHVYAALADGRIQTRRHA